ncbi:MAG: type II secretion system GspH family protein [bacterium]|nr:type II secretion system GspH family protein [bacterium]
MKKGFTLIEIIVVTGIIGVLSTIVLIQAQSFKTKTQAKVRSEFINQTVTALELHYARKGFYPDAPSAVSRCLGKKDGQFCNNGSLQFDGSTVLYNAIKEYLPNIDTDISSKTFYTSSRQGSESSATSKKYDAILYYPGSSDSLYPLACASSMCQGYELNWYTPGVRQSCSPGYRKTCGADAENQARGYSYCQLNIPKRVSDVDTTSC